MPFNCKHEYRRSGSLKETNKRLNNKNFTHKFTSKWHQKHPLNRLQTGTAKRAENCTSNGWKHVRKTSLHTNLLAIKVRKNKLLSSLTFKHKLPIGVRQEWHQRRIIRCTGLNSSPSAGRRRNCIQKQYLQVAKQGHIQQWTRRNQAAVTASPIKR